MIRRGGWVLGFKRLYEEAEGGSVVVMLLCRGTQVIARTAHLPQVTVFSLPWCESSKGYPPGCTLGDFDGREASPKGRVGLFLYLR